MTPFLKYVATDLRKKIGDDLSRTVVVFPNKRASLFLNEHLLNVDDKAPIWSPRYESISQLFRSLSPLQTVDSIEAVCTLYGIYKHHTGNTESPDFFYGWGERLLADFDDVDKNMADPARLFRNLKEIKELDSDFLDEEQEKVLREFFRDFSLHNNSVLRERYLKLWNQLLPIYHDLNATLAADGWAYEGQLYRQVVENLEKGTTQLSPDIDRYVFVGFNVLDKVEERLFAFLQQQGKAMFYWDYDVFYAGRDKNFEAGVFVRRNLEKFGNELPDHIYDNLCHDKQINFVAAPSENIQARSVAPWLEKHLTKEEKRTAIVLCNEALLQPVVHSLPPHVKEVNITKGFPLHHTPAFNLVEEFFDRHINADNAEANQPEVLLQVFEQLSIVLEEKAKALIINEKHQKPEERGITIERELYVEAYFKIHTLINRFKQLITKNKLPLTLTTTHRLFRQVMRQTSIPFHGEPAVGLQIMGVLETRCLDFENILMLSVNEGVLPQSSNDNSFIPYLLRKEYGLTTSQHKTAVYAYYFYRLIQRAKHITMLFNCADGPRGKGERSRFMTQLLIESPLHIRQMAITDKTNASAKMLPVIEKPHNLPELLQTLSPSAINNYIKCQLRFYFERIARLREPDPPATEIKANTFGTIFHRAAELMYTDKLIHRNNIITKETLQHFLQEEKNVAVERYVKQAFVDCEIVPNDIVEQVVKRYLLQLIRHDLKLAPFKIKGTELNTEVALSIPYGEKSVSITLKGNIDRLDLVNIDGITTLRVVDYKTGGKEEKPQNIEQLFTPAKNHPHYALQTFLYSLTLLDTAEWPIAPALFFVHRAAGEDYSPYISLGVRNTAKKVMNFADIATDFRAQLTQLIAQILNPDIPFTATPFEDHCKHCPFKVLCHKL